MLNLPIVEKAFKYIITAFLCFWTICHARAQEPLDSELDRYEEMCIVCLELRVRMNRGEQISREEAKATIDFFVATNRRLKAKESEMTAVQHQRFRDVGEWFSTGVRPCRPDALPVVSSCLPSRLYLASDDTDLLQPDMQVYSRSSFRPDFVVLAEVAVPCFAYGLRAGLTGRRYGGYASFRTNFVDGSSDYMCSSDGRIEGGSVMWPSGVVKTSVMTVAAGVMVNATYWMTLYAGAGYGHKQLFWQDVGGRWAGVSDYSAKGVTAELGCIFRWNHMAFSAGFSSVGLKTGFFTCGLGLAF